MQQTLIHADIFFYVTTIAVVVIGVILAFCLFYLLRIIKDASDIARKFRREADKVVADLDSVREHVKDRVSVSAILGFLSGFLRGQTKAKSTRTRHKTEKDE